MPTSNTPVRRASSRDEMLAEPAGSTAHRGAIVELAACLAGERANITDRCKTCGRGWTDKPVSTVRFASGDVIARNAIVEHRTNYFKARVIFRPITPMSDMPPRRYAPRDAAG